MAGDYVINYILKRERIGAVITKVQILLDNKYADWTTEDVYDDILKSGMAPKETLDVHLDLGGEGNDGKNGQGPGDKGGKGKDVQKDPRPPKGLANMCVRSSTATGSTPKRSSNASSPPCERG